ncbi:helix-turn-helix transcriptional regulator [Candidatus Williamhamiltonella defendens]|uniref:helix-turn-helix transcriptional regulator n=1 Tax=Candidatus Williamhamiltonella defendens TaxID=138072 RepID=UPI0015818806|nr:LuxR family transcriptional regulator [Candidatus Hamiltonella defensa]
MSKMFFKNELINKKVKEYLEENMLKNHKNKFGYLVIHKKDFHHICIISNCPEWFDIYLEFNHQLIDPVVIKALSRVEDFEWDENILISSKLALPKVLDQAKTYDISRGHTFVLHDYKQNLAILSIFDDRPLKTNDFFIDREKMYLLLVKTHQKLLSLYEKFEIPTKKNIGLSKRENEILHWASIGKTYQEISKIIGIKECSIKFHMKNITNKLGAINSRHAIKLAYELKLLKQISYDF